MNKPDVKKLILLNLPYVFAFYFADKIAAVFRLAPGTAFIDKLTNGFAVFGTAFANPLPSFHPVDLLIGLSAGVLLKLAVYVKGKNRKKFRQGEEYGSARWGKPEDIKPYMDPEFSNNVILTQTEFLTMNSRPKQPKYARNKNILVIGGSGSGKTRFFVKPNLMQMHSSYVVTDPKGTVLVECGKMLEKGGYVIKSLNTINFRKSMHYNPFSYIRSEKDILKLVNTIIVNTKGDGDKSGEDFWVKAEKLYYTALIGYIWYEAPDHEKNFTTLLEMINASEAREDDETFKNPVDVMFDELEARDPDHFAVKQYRKYKLAAGKAQAVLGAAAGTDKFSIVGAVAAPVSGFLIGLALLELRIVIGELLIEYQNVLRPFQGGPPCVEKASTPALVPYPLIAEHREVGGPQHLIIGALSKEQHRTLRLDRPAHRLPKLRERQGHIPKVAGRAIGRIGQEHINRVLGQGAQALDAVHKEQPLRGSRGLRDILSQG